MQQQTLSTIKEFDVTIDGESINEMVAHTEVFQDVFLPAWSANIHLMDSQNILMNLNVRVGTVVTISMSTQFPSAKSKSLSFVIYKISDRVQVKQSTQGYLLSMIDKGFLNNQITRVSRAFDGVPLGGVVDTICKEYGLGVLEENDVSAPNYSIVIPNMSPFASIAWLSKYSSVDKISDLLFYQSDPSKYKFRSLEVMFNDDSGVIFKQFYPNVFDSSKNVALEDFHSFENYEFVTNHDAMSKFAIGYYGSKFINYEVSSKSLQTHEFNFGDDIPKDKEKNDFKGGYFDNSTESNISWSPTSKNAFNNTGVSDDWQLTYGSRKSSIGKMDANRLVMTVPGNVNHFKLLGKMVTVKLPSNQDETTEKFDPQFKGEYVVLAIKHLMNPDSYRCIMELGKKRMKTKFKN